jgi:hypothetical protein
MAIKSFKSSGLEIDVLTLFGRNLLTSPFLDPKIHMLTYLNGLAYKKSLILNQKSFMSSTPNHPSLARKF